MTTVSGGVDLLGELLEGRYRVDAPIARGGMSTVYRGLDTRLDRPVAIKVMDPVFADDPEFLSRFEFEARAVARLSHPALVSVHDQGSDRGHAFLVMELVEGGTLRELLRERGAMDVPVALSVLEPVLAALSTAHRAGLVHRDVKPENVLIADDGTVKVADFGLVRAVAAANVTSRNVILGTAAYLCPEQVVSGTADARSDVYATGVLLYELLAGRPPYGGDTALSIAFQHVHNDVPRPGALVEGIPPELDEVVARATRRDPAQRYRDAGELLGVLVRLRRSIGLPRVRVPTPRRSAEHLSQRTTGAGPQHTRAITTVTARTAPHDTRQRDDADPAPTITAYEAERRRSRRVGVAWFVVVLLVAAAVGIGAWWLGSGRFTAVPQLAGLDKAQAQQLLADAQLDATVQTGYDDQVAADRVLAARPDAGARVERGSAVLLTVSLGRPKVPDVAVGTVRAVVEQRVREVRLRPVVAAGAYDDAVAEGGLLGMDPAPGTALAVDSPVRLTLSMGPAPVAVPEVAGRSVTDATAVLSRAGLQVGSTSRAFNPTVTGGAVVRTDPPAGGPSRRGSAVNLVVSSALTVPDVTGQSPEAARRALVDVGLRPVDGGTSSAGTVAAGAVAATVPAAGALVDPASAQVRVVLSDAVTVPGLRGRSVGTARAALTALGLQVQVNQLVPTDTSLVVSQSVQAGVRVAPGATITLVAFP